VFVCEKKPEEPGAYRCISRFEIPGALKAMRFLYFGRSHYNVLKVIPKTMPKTGGKVAVELRERGAASGPTLVAKPSWA
jgi:hypothetical protein